MQNDIFYLIYLINQRSNIIVKTPFGNTYPFLAEEIVKQGTVLGPNSITVPWIMYVRKGKGINMEM